ncbi:MAG TPA: class I SAM-dependent methyltransferase [Acidimicrobiia bacterium]
MTTATPAFADALDAVAGVAGWMTDDQARRLWDRARAVPAGGRIVEIGSYQGRSAIVLALAAAPDVEIVAIDPHAGNDRGPQELEGSGDDGERDHAAFVANVARAGVRDRVRHVRLPSHEAHQEVAAPIDLLYIDGAHRYGPARADIRDWGAEVADGATILIHDSFCSVGVTGAIAVELLGSRGVDYVGRVGSLAEYRRRHLDRRGRWRSTGRQLAELPYFLWSLLIKVLLVLRLRPVTRLLGNRRGEWPY